MKLKDLLLENINEKIISEIETFASAFTGLLNDSLIEDFYDGVSGALKGKFDFDIKKNVINIKVSKLDTSILSEYHNLKSLKSVFYNMNVARTAKCETYLCDENITFEFSGLKLLNDVVTYKLKIL